MRRQKKTGSRLSLSSPTHCRVLEDLASAMLRAKTAAEKAAVVDDLAELGIEYSFPAEKAARPLPFIPLPMAASEEK